MTDGLWILCDVCWDPLTVLGGLLFSPPGDGGAVIKQHVCINCYRSADQIRLDKREAKQTRKALESAKLVLDGMRELADYGEGESTVEAVIARLYASGPVFERQPIDWPTADEIHTATHAEQGVTVGDVIPAADAAPRVVKIPRWAPVLVYVLCAAGIIVSIATAPDTPGWLVGACLVSAVPTLLVAFAVAAGRVRFEYKYKEKPGE